MLNSKGPNGLLVEGLPQTWPNTDRENAVWGEHRLHNSKHKYRVNFAGLLEACPVDEGSWKHLKSPASPLCDFLALTLNNTQLHELHLHSHQLRPLIVGMGLGQEPCERLHNCLRISKRGDVKKNLKLLAVCRHLFCWDCCEAHRRISDEFPLDIVLPTLKLQRVSKLKGNLSLIHGPSGVGDEVYPEPLAEPDGNKRTAFWTSLSVSVKWSVWFGTGSDELSKDPGGCLVCRLRRLIINIIIKTWHFNLGILSGH